MDPELSIAWYSLGRVLLAQSEFEDAAGALEMGARLCPDHWVTLQSLARSLAALDRHDEAIVQLTRAHRENPKAASVLVERSKSYRHLGRLQNAAEDLEAALVIQPNGRRIAAMLQDVQNERRSQNE